MIRVLALLVRRPDITREAFRAHYEGTHAPLAQSILPPFAHYLRNHVVEGDVPFDVMTEFGYASGEVLVELNETLGSEAGDPIRADEQTFMDQAKNAFFGIRNLVEPGRPRLDPDARERMALLATRSGDEDGEAFRERYLGAFAAAVPADVAARHWSSQKLVAEPRADVVSFVDPAVGHCDLAPLREAAGALVRIRVATDWSIRAERW